MSGRTVWRNERTDGCNQEELCFEGMSRWDWENC